MSDHITCDILGRVTDAVRLLERQLDELRYIRAQFADKFGQLPINDPWYKQAEKLAEKDKLCPKCGRIDMKCPKSGRNSSGVE